jgi:hypothetical protein
MLTLASSSSSPRHRGGEPRTATRPRPNLSMSGPNQRVMWINQNVMWINLRRMALSALMNLSSAASDPGAPRREVRHERTFRFVCRARAVCDP